MLTRRIMPRITTYSTIGTHACMFSPSFVADCLPGSLGRGRPFSACCTPMVCLVYAAAFAPPPVCVRRLRLACDPGSPYVVASQRLALDLCNCFLYTLLSSHALPFFFALLSLYAHAHMKTLVLARRIMPLIMPFSACDSMHACMFFPAFVAASLPCPVCRGPTCSVCCTPTACLLYAAAYLPSYACARLLGRACDPGIPYMVASQRPASDLCNVFLFALFLSRALPFFVALSLYAQNDTNTLMHDTPHHANKHPPCNAWQTT